MSSPMVDNSKDHGKLLPILSLTIVFLRVLTSISVDVSRKIAGREKEKQFPPPSYHFHGLYILIEHSSRPISAREIHKLL